MTLGLFPKQADENFFPSLVLLFRSTLRTSDLLRRVPRVGDPFRSITQDTGQGFSWDVGKVIFAASCSYSGRL